MEVILLYCFPFSQSDFLLLLSNTHGWVSQLRAEQLVSATRKGKGEQPNQKSEIIVKIKPKPSS